MIIRCLGSDTGMAASLTHGVRLSLNACERVIALGDLPFVEPETMQQIVAALLQGANIVVPTYNGARSNLVDFSRKYFESSLQIHSVIEVPVDDLGVCQDIDTVLDLQTSWSTQDHSNA